MSTSGGLTDEQKRKIEENRQKALAKRAQKLSQSPNKSNFGSNKTATWQNSGSIRSNVTAPAVKAVNTTVPASVKSSSCKTGNVSTYGQSVSSKSYTQNSLSNQINKHSAQTLTDQNVTSNKGSMSGTYKPYSGGASSTNSASSTGGTCKPFSNATQSNSATCSSGSGTHKPFHGASVSTNSASSGLGTHKPFSNASSSTYSSSSGSGTYKPFNSASSTNSALLSGPYKPFNASTTTSSTTFNNPPNAPGLTKDTHTVDTNKPRNIFTANVKPVRGQCILISRERFEVKVGYSQPLIELFKGMKTKMYDAVTKKWSFKLEEYETFMKEIAVLKPHVIVEPLPRAVLQVFSQQLKGNYPNKDIPDADLSDVDVSLVNSLLSFQREGVNFGVSKNGRVLVADDMGLGKTIQAICLACYYRDEWPLLIIVPSSVRFDWAQQIRRWVPSIDPQEISVALSGKDTSSSQVNIVTYDLVARKAKNLQEKHFQVVIVDECHLLKNYKTARCKAALPILQNAHRVILLSGTPALSRPSELYTQISAISPFMFKFQDFGVRYCEGKQQPWGWDFSGSSNMGELQILLEEKIMIRRLKKDVLTELPSKVRQMILLDPGAIKSSKDLKKASKVMDIKNLKGMERRGALLEYFHHTGTAKIPAVRDYIADLLEADRKFLLFAHHQEFLDAMEELAQSKLGKYYIRIDGKTSPEQRNHFCKKFQENPDMKMAILSITAANAGINLSAASLVVFGELFWNPGILVQAEDRAHRMGQQDMVNVHYLVAQNTADDQVWPLVQKKLDVLNKAGLSKDDFSSADTTRLKDTRQSDLMQYFEESFIEDDDSFISEDTDTVLENNNKEEKIDQHQKKDGSLLNYFSCKKKECESGQTGSVSQNMEPSASVKGQGSNEDIPVDDLDLLMDDDDWTDDIDEPQTKKLRT